MRTSTARALAALAAVCVVGGCSGTPAPSPASNIVRSTTNIAGAGVVGAAGRETPPRCGAPAAPDDAGRPDGTRVVSGAGTPSVVPADPQRIVVLDTGALDAACATGVWERVVGAATRTDVITQTPGTTQPAFLGAGIGRIPGVGPEGSPDLGKIAALAPDLIVGSDSLPADVVARLREVAPTVLTRASSSWRDRSLLAAAALGRRTVAATALADLRREAADLGTQLAASATEASVVRVSTESATTLGPETFAGELLGLVGVRRPAPQASTSVEVDPAAPRAAEGDLIYVIFAPGALEKGRALIESDAWRSLGASTDGRVFTVDDAVWTGEGISAARSLLVDLQSTLNGYAPQ